MLMRLVYVSTTITPVHLALFDAVTGILRESGTPPAEAAAAMVDITFWLAAAATAQDSTGSQALAQTIASRAFAGVWDSPFRQV